LHFTSPKPAVTRDNTTDEPALYSVVPLNKTSALGASGLQMTQKLWDVGSDQLSHAALPIIDQTQLEK
jgi:hypothetical protein